MPFNFLLDEYPDEVIVENVVYKVRCDFRVILSIMQLLDNPTFSDDEKLYNALSIFYEKEIPNNIIDAYTEMIDFIRVYDQDISKNKSDNKILDFEIDSGMIYAAFLQLYHIDIRVEKIHWFKFNCLLENINDGKPKLLHIMEIRDMEIDNDMSPKQRLKLRKLKREYSLEKQEDISNSFANSFFLGVKGGVKNGK
ncbi:MAG: Gp15 family bacteriophage protein [Anaerorhabdus sp.]